MRRRRRHLEVSTFPFLAVLLCTMGSLILLLLVLDRRAKVVAMMKAQSEVAAVQADKEKDEEERRRQEAEWEQKRQQLHALVALQEEELLGQIQDAKNQVSAAGIKVQNEQARTDQLKNQLQISSTNLVGLQTTLKAQQETAAAAEKQTQAAKLELERQAAALQQLEQTLAALKLLRERQKNTYSLVPYLGRRGDNRRPIYVECTYGGLIFHPDEVALEQVQLTSERLRDEVEKRIAGQPPAATTEPQRPYLLMLVRPDGISTYYRATRALSGMTLDFGYEFIDADWVLDFSAANGDGPRQPWMTAAKLPGQNPPPSMPQPPLPGGVGFAAMPQMPGSSGTGKGNGSGGFANGGSFGGSGVPGGEGGGSGWPASGTMPKGVASGMPGMPQGGFAASQSGVDKGGGSANGQGSAPGAAIPGGGWQPSSPGQAPRPPAPPGEPGAKPDGAKLNPGSPGGGTGGTKGSGSSESANGAESGAPGIPNNLPRLQIGGGTTKGEAGQPGNATPSGSKQASENGGEAGIGGGSAGLGSPAMGGKAAPVAPPLGRILGNRDWPIYIECTATGVTVKQGGEKFTIEALAAPTRGEHPLAQTIKQMIARRQATVRAGEPPYRPLLRFQVRPDGMQAYYLAYPLLDSLRLPMARENLDGTRKP